MDCSPPGSSVCCISQSRILEWVAISFSRGSSQTRDRTHVSCFGRWILYHWTTREALQHFVCFLWRLKGKKKVSGRSGGKEKSRHERKIGRVLERGVSSSELSNSLQMRGNQTRDRLLLRRCRCRKEEMRSQLKVTALRKNYFRWRTKNSCQLSD